ncbi:MAG TPA: ribonuclease III [Dehalococcoidales bacterium]|nr:ribonuclease III [Dehalococcoidales bacterium]
MADLAALQETIGVSFNNLALLEQAMVHSSYVNENPAIAPIDNERLEFLGDAILGLIIAEKLYRDFPELTEGEMTRFRSVLVCRETLACVAEAVKLGDYLYLGKGEEASGGRHKTANLAGALEAVIAAGFLDRGLAVTRKLVLKLLSGELRKVTEQDVEVDYKSRLQELIQSKYQVAPAYRLVEATGPDHDRIFTVEVMAGDIVLGRGSGKSKKLAETEAARLALEFISTNFKW